jgi:hypothetical protein
MFLPKSRGIFLTQYQLFVFLFKYQLFGQMDKKSPNRAKNPRRNFAQQKRHSLHFRRRSTRHNQRFLFCCTQQTLPNDRENGTNAAYQHQKIVCVQKNSK